MSKVVDIKKKQLEIIRDFAYFRTLIQEYSAKEADDKSIQDLKYFTLLMYMPVTSSSLFHDDKWDYNSDEQGASVNSQGSSLIIPYGKYENIPEFIIIEVKCLTQLYFLTPSSFKSMGRKRSRIKANTLVALTKYGLAYLDTLFRVMGEEYGKEYVDTEFHSLTQINRSTFDKAASHHPKTFNADLKVFLDNLSHPFARQIFDAQVDVENSQALSWKRLAGYTGKSPQQVIPEEVFEPLILNASLLVSDFLITQGIEPEDKIVVKHLGLRHHSVELCSDAKVDKQVFDAYTTIRLINAGYENSFIVSCVPGIRENSLACNGTKLFHTKTISDRVVNQIERSITDLQLLINVVKYAAQFLVAQFSGMRPGELSEVPLNGVTEENGFLLLRGRVIKGREMRFKGLFDDKWIVIPIMHDAIKALGRLGRIQQNTKLFSATHTVGPNDEHVDMRSSSWSNQVNALLGYVFNNKNPHELKFNAYMTRHTLAHLLFRADVGLPFITYQLKHLIEDVARYTSEGKHSDITISYGSIGDELARGTTGLRKKAEIEGIKSVMDPDGVYLGPKGEEHKKHLQKIFQGYIAAGYSKYEVFEAMAEQGLALVNVGQGFCYGGRMEDFDESIPCIGSLRCNPLRCQNAIVTKANAPKWREVYILNKMNLDKPEYADNVPQMLEAMQEAEGVLNYLGEKVTM